MTKQGLLLIMLVNGACSSATKYVENHASDDAAVIGGTCDRADWLMWMLCKQDRLDRFVSVAAKRAQRKSGPQATYATEINRIYRTSASLRLMRVYDVAACALSNAIDPGAEQAAQLRGLRRVWRDWCAGKPAEKALPL